MSEPKAVLAEPLTLGQDIPRGTKCSGKVLLLSSLLMGLAFALSFKLMPFTRSEIEEPAIDMFGAQLAKPPAALPMSASCPAAPKIPVNAMMDTLRQHNFPSSPVEKYVLTAAAAARDVSMKAQAKEEFERLDPETQAKFKKLAKDVVVRAASLKPEEMAGVTAPLGFFDPAGISKVADIGALRTIELKHGRICMLATLGIIVSEKFHPFFDGWNDGPFVSAAATHFTPTAFANFWPAYWVMTLCHEVATEMSGNYGEEGWAPKSIELVPWAKTRGQGDFGFDPLGLKPTDPAALKTMQDKELNNGRLAMFAAMGMLAQELVTGKAIF